MHNNADVPTRTGNAILFALCVAAMVLLASCAGTTPAPEPRVITREVAVPVPDYSCQRGVLERLGPEPEYPDREAALVAAPNIFERVKLLLAGRVLRIQRDIEKSAALRACGG